MCRENHYENQVITEEIINSRDLVEINKYCGIFKLEEKILKNISIEDELKIFQNLKKTFDRNFILHFTFCQHKRYNKIFSLNLKSRKILYDFIEHFEKYCNVNLDLNLRLVQSISYRDLICNIEYLKSFGFIKCCFYTHGALKSIKKYNGELKENDHYKLNNISINLEEISSHVVNKTLINLYCKGGWSTFNFEEKEIVTNQIKKYLFDKYEIELVILGDTITDTYIVKNKFPLVKRAIK